MIMTHAMVYTHRNLVRIRREGVLATLGFALDEITRLYSPVAARRLC